ncbi:beta strand repeat-containing protein [Sphingomonas alpina]|uniref:Calcium-binding protein n=1 Tax=Sphingomonas alpina TaxID=653931 RepID=A0A7H0LK69_9SPHN|nr:calcium-binding protein [Sphingomonas alpina]QNQ10072.1 calcium-binding protein [Sphingomonas alpina]
MQSVKTIWGSGYGDTITIANQSAIVTIFAGDGDDTINGSSGADTIHAGAGADIVNAGDGADRIYIDAATEVGAGEQINGGNGFDTIFVNNKIGLTDLSGATFTGIEQLNGTFAGQIGVATTQLNNIIINGSYVFMNGGTVSLTGVAVIGTTYFYLSDAGNRIDLNQLVGFDSPPIFQIIGGAGDDTIISGRFGTSFGMGGNDTLIGRDGYDVLNGGDGNDRLDGHSGGDQLIGGKGDDYFIIDESSDTVLEYDGQGNDTVESSISISFTQSVFIETLILTGTANIDATGDARANMIIGNAGNNRLDGGAGADTMQGGAGNDTYYVDVAGDSVLEAVGGGTDIVFAAKSFALGAGQEIETLATASDAGTGLIDLTGNEFANTLRGNAGANRLDGGAGGDRLYGGKGNDTYVIDNSLDRVIELDGEGTDTVLSSVSFSFSGLTGLENLTLTGSAAINGTGNALNNVLIGNAAANILDGGAGTDTMQGGLGNDTYYVDVAGDVVLEGVGGGSDTVLVARSYALAAGQEIETLATANDAGTGFINLTGNEFANTLRGNAGGNILDGGAGGDRMYGGLGNDVYVVDHSLDRVIELDGEGTDLVQSSISFSLNGLTGLENLTLTGAAAINGTGNALANILIGNGAANILDGGAGIDAMQGGLGNDIYYVDVAEDIVREAMGGGNDTVLATRAYILGAGQEIETLATANDAGTSFINLTGNTFVNTLRGNAGGNRLDGGLGSDTLTGLGGADTFVFDTALGTANVDTITDFVHGTDRIELDQSVFAGLGLGTLSASAFSNGPATTADQHILYDAATGTLSYDADGSGAGAAIIFATLANHPATITSADFLVVP